MTLLELNQLNSLHYTLLIAFSSGLFFLAYHKKNLEDYSLHMNLRLLGVAFFVAIAYFKVYDLSFFKSLMIAETLYFVTNALSLLAPEKKNMQFSISAIYILVSALISLYISFSNPWQDYMSIDLRWLVIFQVGAIMLNAILLYRKKSDHANFGAFAFNAIGSIILSFLFTLDGLFFMLVFRAGFYFSLYQQLLGIIRRDEAKRLEAVEALDKDFQEHVRKEVNHRLFYMELSKEKMSKIAKTDSLTDALNKKAMFDTMDLLITNKKTETFSILMFDIDKFKTLNDTYGHVVGDQCLKTLSRTAKDSIRDHDHLCRYGGDEFVIILTDADLRTAVIVAERFRQNIEKTENPSFTVSIGVANFPLNGKTSKELIQHADEGLYLSKEKGRNRVSYYTPPKINP